MDHYNHHHPPSRSFSPPPSYYPIRVPAVPPDPLSQPNILLAPVPQSIPVPPLDEYEFVVPTKRIRSINDIRRFNDYGSGKLFLGFIVSLSESVRGRKNSDPCHESGPVTAIIHILETLTTWIDQIPPVRQEARYGNVAYRTWHEKMVDHAVLFMELVLEDDVIHSMGEIIHYFIESFGNASRIDYGTGHETNFAAWLYCLVRLEEIGEEDYPALVSMVFVQYLDLMRKLQLVYRLEPAGSHGLWALDDYQFLPYVFGSSQLIGHKYMKPKSIHNRDILVNFKKEYMYLGCIAFIRKVKNGVFSEHSPMLDDISGASKWDKVHTGLLKMYKAEVLEKVSIMQHFRFGSIIEW